MLHAASRLPWLALSFVVFLMSAAPVDATLASFTNCLALSIVLPGKVWFPASPRYLAFRNSYFAAFENEVAPVCVVQPTSAQDVSKAIKYLRPAAELSHVNVAVRGGGHTAWAGSANIEGGITIDLVNIKGVELNSVRTTTSIGAGEKWRAVYEKLDKLGLAVVGGRVSKVGVVGLTTGGGLSYYSADKGFVCDSVISFEVVLSTGEIVTATKDSHADLWQALKGGSAINFGIVTKITFPTFKQGQMWGGAIFYSPSAYPQLLDAFTDFSYQGEEEDTKATLIVAASYVAGYGETAVSNLYHNLPNPNPPVFKPFTDLQPQLQDTLRQDSLLGFTEEQSAFSTDGARQWFFTTSFKIETKFLQDVHDTWLDVVKERKLDQIEGWLNSLVYHPVTKKILEKTSAQKNGNSLGLKASDDPFVICLLNTVHANAADDAKVRDGALETIRRIEALAKQRGKETRYRFLNYGFKDQRILEGYGAEVVSKLRAVSKKYDPTQFFQNRVPGGFKVSKAKV